jgi:hypothetical protein
MAKEKSIAPYAPIRNVLDVLHRLRDRGIPNPLTPETIQSIGVPDGNAHRTVQTFKLLGLVDEAGSPTESASRLRQASTDEYPAVLAEVVRAAYQEVFELVDPAQDTDVAIADAFRRFEPAGQRYRMVPLFMGLSAEAGIIPPERAVQPRGPSAAAARERPRKERKAAVRTDGGSSTPPAQRHDAEARGHLFAISDADVAALTDDEFKAVWDALGTVARARARSLSRAASETTGKAQGEE